ncbi:sugar phosphate nucleotidyltransferase [Nitriliruptor alkaliphilus]|uniref:sugar phosphate nucleotidyltransferase n=1 Tax=Nitriliruptor alkaliphilus TaxID=427918 RepID=UPI000696BB5A|nr:NDP-sugar synthase [Nitriliruptor alkaliphilus]
MTVREACIVAGGAGTRLRPLTTTTPKPLLPFCGEPFLVGVLARLAAVGVERVLLVVGADPIPFEVLEPHADALGVTLEFVPEPTPLDTAGGVRAALDRVTGTFLVLNGDILTDVDLAAAIAAHRDADAAATLVLTRVEDTSSFGVCVLDGTRITAFVEKPDPGTLPGQDAVNAGTYVLEPGALSGFPVGRLSFERQVFPQLVAAGQRVEGFVSDAAWADLGTPERYLTGHRLALDGELAWPSLDAVGDAGGGVRIASDAWVADDARLVGPVLLQRGARVERGASVGPYVVIGAGGTVGEDSNVVDSVLADRVHLGADVVAHRLLAGQGARVASGTVLGRDVVLGDDVRLDPASPVPDGARVPDPAA